MPRPLSPGSRWTRAIAAVAVLACVPTTHAGPDPNPADATVATDATVASDVAVAAQAGQEPQRSAPAASSTSRPLAVTYSDGTLILRPVGKSRRPALVARWPVEDIPDEGHGYRTARLELLDDDDEQSEVTRGLAVTLPIHDRAEWNAVVVQVMTELAPAGANEAALTLVQGDEIVFYLTPDRELRVHRHEDKPAGRHVTRFVDEAEFAAHADTLLHRQFPDQHLLLFQAGDGEGELSFVFFDLARRQSVLIAAPPAAQAGTFANLMRMLIRVPDMLILRGQALGVLTRPISSAARLAWFATQTVATLPPPIRATGETPPPVMPRPGMDLAAWERELDDMDLPRRYPGTIVPLIDGEAFFTSFVQALQDARDSVSIRLFIFDNDDYALRIADLLKRRSEEVRVRILIDGMGTLGAAQGAPEGAASRPPFSIAGYLRADSHVKVRETPNTWLMADHTKTLIVDDRLAYLGGMNIGHEYRHDWHDMMVGLTGPIVGRLQRDFDFAWSYAGLGGDLAYLTALGGKERFVGSPLETNYVDIRPLYTRTLDPQVLRAQVAAMRRAEREIWVEQPYVSDDALVNELIAARARGVDVRIVLPSSGDSRFMNSANLLTARALVKSGVRVFVYPGMTHVKAALYDGWACLGSANFDKLSLRVNRETNVATSDPAFTGRLRQELFEADFARSRELVKAPSTGWGTYISAFVAGQL
jgi:cardiolipin synthase A/B